MPLLYSVCPMEDPGSWLHGPWSSFIQRRARAFPASHSPGGEGGRRLKLSHILTLALSGALLTLGGVAVRADQESTCPVSGHKVTVTDKTVSLTVNGQKQYFCCADCPAAFVKNPSKYVKGEVRCPVMTSNKVDLAKSPRVVVNDNL